MDSDVFDPGKEIRKGGQTGEVMLQRQKTCVVHTEATCSRDVWRGHAEGTNRNTCTHKNVGGTCFRDMSPRVN